MTARATPADTPVAPSQERVPDVVDPVGQAQAPAVPIVIPGILESSGVSFTTLQFSGAAFRWWEAYERHRPVSATTLICQEFSILFLEKFVPQSRREELRRSFEKVRQDSMSVTQYEMKFLELARHAIWLVLTDRERIISQERGEREAKRPQGSGGFGGVPSRGKSYHHRGRPYIPAQTTRPAHRGTSAIHGSYSPHSGQSSFSALPAQSSRHASSAQASIGSSSGYLEQQFRHRRGCFECEDFSHIKSDCPRLLSGALQ
ncbi:uncharacterized protein [Nicotiana tomentosiformis]|uniref:uncharacterized protein n=1 Tax=Nicotiana tomentosiformis TaxID=4098 RepID=UPI00388C8EFD